MAEDKPRKGGNGKGVAARSGAVMVVGGGVAGMQASLDLANSGFCVHMVEAKPAIGGVMAQLDKTFPTNDCSMCIISPKLVECGRHLNINIHTLTEVKAVSGEPGNLTVTLEKQPRYIDPAKCTGCGECANVCPVAMPDEFNMGLADWHAAYRLYPQAIPAAFGIKKLDRAPCTITCPAEINVQGYVQLIKMSKYEEAVKLIMERLPLPGVLGRVCPHPCESKCRRAELDEPVAICSLKRFAADQVDLGSFSPPLVEAKPEKIAIIGSGPAGLSCAYHLALKGYRPTIFEALPQAGGMLRVGIPDYRLPKNVLDREIDNILRLGVTLKTNTALGRDFTLDSLVDEGHKAVFLGIGCHVGKPLGIANESAPGVVQGVDLLRRHNLGEPQEIGKSLAVIGGGNVAIDVACTARRLGSDVTIVYRRSREEMPAFAHEVEQALCEGVKIIYLAAPLEVVVGAEGKAIGLICQKMELGEPDASGRRKPVPIPNETFELPVDMIVPAIGQEAAQGPLADCGLNLSRWGTIEVDEITYQTSRPGVFAAGDVHTGPWIAIEAVGGGIEAAESIDRYLQGLDLKEGRVEGEEAHKRWAAIPKDEEGQLREVMPTMPPELSCACFDEIAQGFTLEQAQREAGRCLNCGVCSECMQCVVACQAGAVDHSQKPETLEVKVGAVIISPGFQTFDPVKYGTYHYAQFPNVVTSLEFERILSASGPFQGHLVRPSDHKEPKKIAWLQCVGSRDVKTHSYCSAVCCMYAIKEAVIAKEHCKEYDLDAAIFFMDMRTFGKDFEQYYNRAKDEQGVRFIRSRIHTIDPAPDDNLLITYLDESGEKKSEVFDMVVMSVGMEVSQGAKDLAQTLGVDANSHDFVATTPFAPVAASRPGVYACGAMQGPKDIPESVMQASAAAGAVSAALGEARWSETLTREIPPQKEIRPEDQPRVGVFVCNCGINIGGIIDVPGLRDYAAKLPNVVYTADNLFTCSQDTQVQMTKIIEEENLNRVVVAACTPITHEPLFRETMIDAGLNKYLFEMANIRNQDSWVHMKEPDKATDKAKDLVRMAVARASLLKPLVEKPLTINQRAVVIGGGVAGMNAALNLADQGFETIILEKEDRLGGNAWRVHHTIEGQEVLGYLEPLIEKVKGHSKIQVLTGALVVGFSGYKGNFTTEVLVGPAMYERKIDHGVVVVATGGQEYRPKEFRYGEHPRILTQLEFGDLLHASPEEVAQWQRVAFIQCVGSRNPENPNCSRICCQGAVKYALQLKGLNPEMDVMTLYRDMRTYGFMEDFYREAREKGVMFSRYKHEDPPQVEVEGGLSITFLDHVLERPIKMPVDAVVLSAAALPNDTEELASLLKIPRNAAGFFIEAHAKLRPVDFASEGIFLCGLAHSPKLISESIAQAMAAASRAGAFLADTRQTISGVTAHVEPDRCAACLVCVRSCPYNVPQITGDNVSEINPALCQGCGTCASECPANVIQVAHFEDDQIAAKIKTLF